MLVRHPNRPARQPAVLGHYEHYALAGLDQLFVQLPGLGFGPRGATESPDGAGPEADLAPIDAHMTGLWQQLGFEVHPLADFNSFARRQGVVHCIKKYLRRGD